MKWTTEAETAIKKVTFFVRKRVRLRVEKDAAEAGKKVVSIADVKTTQARFLEKMSSEIKGFQVETCFGSSGCPNRANSCDGLLKKTEELLEKKDILSFLKQRVKGDVKFHHEFKVTMAECPNACSQPQIKDIGIICACMPMLTDETCTPCDACVDECKENAISIQSESNKPKIDYDLCLACGKCIKVCPSGTIATDIQGFRVQLGGKLGRHPRLATELDGIFSEDEVFEIVNQCVEFYKKNCKNGERFAEIFKLSEFQNF
jgi:dissimilatory sulfite reductase (desulfoviridin) alpha/beta subunit